MAHTVAQLTPDNLAAPHDRLHLDAQGGSQGTQHTPPDNNRDTRDQDMATKTHQDNDVRLGLVGDDPMSHVMYCFVAQDATLVSPHGGECPGMPSGITTLPTRAWHISNVPKYEWLSLGIWGYTGPE